MTGRRAAGAQQRTGTPLGGAFWRLFTSSSASNLSDGVMQAAAPLLAATLTRDPLAISAMGALVFLPWLLFAIPAGTVVDRMNRRTAMAVANAARAVLLSAVGVAVAAGVMTMPLLYGAVFLLGCAETVYDSAARAMLPSVVGRGQLERGNSILSTAENVTNIFLGAPIGAWMFALMAAAPFFGGAGAYLAAGLIILTVTGRARHQRAKDTVTAGGSGPARRTMRADTADGLRWLLRHRLLRTLMITTGASAVFQSMTNGILVLFALENLGLGESAFGLLLAAAGVGAVVGSLAAPRLSAALGRPAAMGVCELVFSATLAAVMFWQHPIGAALLFSIGAAAGSAFNVQIMSLRQALIPEELFGRVQGAYRTILWGGIPIGSLAGGWLARTTGLAPVFGIAGGAGLVIGLVTWRVLYRHRAQIDAAFAVGGEAPAPGEGAASDTAPVDPPVAAG